jgi:hypothetical protein
LNRNVQDELKLNKDQVSKLTQAAAEVRAKHKEEADKLSKEYAAYRTKSQELTRTMNAGMDRAVAAVLKPEQARRLRQIELQARGFAAFIDPEVQKALKLTDAQKQDLQAIQNRVRTNGGGRGSAVPFEQARQQRVALVKAEVEKFVARLTADQQKVWKELAGPPFADLAQLGFFPTGLRFTSPTTRFINPVSWVSNQRMQADLKLSAEQVEKLQKIPDEVRGKHREELARVTAWLREYRTKNTDLNNTITNETRQALAQVTAKLFTADQLKRLKEIEADVLARRGRWSVPWQGDTAWSMAGPFAPAVPILNRNVQNELKLSQEQIGKLTRVVSEVRARLNQGSAGTAKEFQEYRTRNAELVRKLDAETDKAIAAILKPEQARRLKQLQLQARQFAAFTDPEVEKALKLTDAQKQDLSALQAGVTRFNRNGPPPAQRGQPRTALLQEAVAKFVAKLTDDQKKAWNELVGPPFADPAQLTTRIFTVRFTTATRTGRRTRASWASNRSVQADLKLSAEQVEKLLKLPAEVSARHREEAARITELMEKYQAKANALNKAVAAETKKALARVVADILTPEQLKRLRQIEVQQLGLKAFSDAEVQKALKLTGEQTKDFQAISEQLSKDIVKARQEAGSDFRNRFELNTKTTALNKEAMDKMVSRLTEEQKKTWKELNGAPFQMTRFGRRGEGFQPPTRNRGNRQ